MERLRCSEGDLKMTKKNALQVEEEIKLDPKVRRLRVRSDRRTSKAALKQMTKRVSADDD